MGLDATSRDALMAKRSAAAEAMFGGTVTIGGASYAAATVGSELGVSFAENGGGEVIEADQVFEIRKDVLATEPARGAAVQWNGTGYRVLRVSNRPHSNVWRVYCKRVQER